MAASSGAWVWYELETPDAEASAAFYDRMLGWGSQAVPMGDGAYTMLVTEGGPQAGLAGAAEGVPPHWVGYLAVDDVDAILPVIQAAGGTILSPAIDFPGVGRAARVADPTGGSLYVFTSASDEPGGSEVAWMELSTTDLEAAVGFYTQVFGYEAVTMEMPMGPYVLLRKDGVDHAGVMAQPMPGVPSMWLPYLGTSDVDAAFSRAQEAGATALSEMMAVEGIGRFAILQDPSGAVVGIHQGA